jgi:hypothetical protein
MGIGSGGAVTFEVLVGNGVWRGPIDAVVVTETEADMSVNRDLKFTLPAGMERDNDEWAIRHLEYSCVVRAATVI